MEEFKLFMKSIEPGMLISYKQNINYKQTEVRETFTMSESVIQGMKEYLTEEEFIFHDFKIEQ